MSSLKDERSEVFNLTVGEELRIETSDNGICVITVVGGKSAEVFGAELAQGQQCRISGKRSIAVFSWYGSKVRISGDWGLAYTSDDTPMRSYLNTHDNLHTMRAIAAREDSSGPTVLILGPPDSGKTSLSTFLMNYAIREGYMPTLVDLDVEKNSLSCPGTISAASLDRVISPNGVLPPFTPISYFYGHQDIDYNVDHFKTSVAELANTVASRLRRNPDERYSGVIIDGISWTESSHIDSIVHVIDAFSVSVVLVVGHDRLFAQLKQVPGITGCNIVKLGKSGGVVAKDSTLKKTLLVSQFKDYFYGENRDLNPRQTVLSFNQVGIYRVGGVPQAPSSALPIGQERVLVPNQILNVAPSSEMMHSILAVSYAKEPSDLITAPTAGFVFVTGVDTKRKQLTVLTPNASALPANCLLFGSIKWYDQ